MLLLMFTAAKPQILLRAAPACLTATYFTQVGIPAGRFMLLPTIKVIFSILCYCRIKVIFLRQLASQHKHRIGRRTGRTFNGWARKYVYRAMECRFVPWIGFGIGRAIGLAKKSHYCCTFCCGRCTRTIMGVHISCFRSCLLISRRRLTTISIGITRDHTISRLGSQRIALSACPASQWTHRHVARIEPTGSSTNLASVPIGPDWRIVRDGFDVFGVLYRLGEAQVHGWSDRRWASAAAAGA
mmetsp:Transcript_17965/g.38957  ORF Transcript_17965/g.38957 Transcript_17965/m.38957 type:complete len:242 (-) Transcript_17965:72-797(-)